jgi:hypothetical protein
MNEIKVRLLRWGDHKHNSLSGSVAKENAQGTIVIWKFLLDALQEYNWRILRARKEEECR